MSNALTPLGHAVAMGQADEVKALLASGADPRRLGAQAQPLIHLAAMYCPDALEAILAKGIAVDETTEFGTTALMMAARVGKRAGVEKLLALGASLEVTDRAGETALFEAARAGEGEIVLLLLDRGADATRSVREVTPFGLATQALTTKQEDEPWALDDIESLAAAIVRLRPTTLSKQDEAIDGRRKKSEAKQKKRADKGKRSAAKAEGELDALSTAEAAQAPDWAERVRALIGPVRKHGATLSALCERVLSTSAAVRHADWPALVALVLDQSERIPHARIEDDESGLLEQYADEHRYTFDFVAKLLGTKPALAAADWGALFLRLCDDKQSAISYLSLAEEEVSALLAMAEVKARADYKQLVKRADKAFPFRKR